MTNISLTKKEAKALTEKVISTLSGSEASIRLVLTEALQYKAYKPLGFSCFKTYAMDCIEKAGVSLGMEYARRQAKAGQVELELEIEICSMPEGALRPLHENVSKHDCRKVFERACENLEDGKYPTRTQILAAAKELNCFKEQQIKKKAPKAVPSEELTSEKDNSAENSSADDADEIKSNVCPIKRPSSSRVYSELTENFEICDIKKVRNFIEAWQLEELKPIFEAIIEAEPKMVNNLKIKLRKFIRGVEDETNIDKLSA
jgi:hypothetical protein